MFNRFILNVYMNGRDIRSYNCMLIFVSDKVQGKHLQL